MMLSFLNPQDLTSDSSQSYSRRYQPNSIKIHTGAAYNYNALKQTGITHIVRAARSARDNYPEDIAYLDVSMCNEQISPKEIQTTMTKTSEFISEATSRKDFKVMVHDWEGAGRSAVLIVAHIMKSRQITYDAAVEIVRKTRPGISIEDAYAAELLQLEQDLHLRAAKSRTTAIGQAHSAGADFSDYDSDMDDAKAFDERAEDSSSSDEFLDEFGSDEDNEDELEKEYYYEDDDGSHFWGYESHDDEESESSESVVSDTFDSNEDHYEEADDDGSHFWGGDSYDDEEEGESSSLSESGSSSDEYWWGHVVDHDIKDDDAFDEGEDDDVSRFVYFEYEDDVNIISSSGEDISVLPKE